jgi:hypothetical protein
MPPMPARPQRDAGTPPAQRVEHALRYALAAPLIDGAAVWADLGAGDGSAQAAGLGAVRARRTVFVDRDEDTARRALHELDGGGEALGADLGDVAALTAMSAAIRKSTRKGAKRVVTCFSTIEQLDGFAALIAELLALADQSFDVVLSVPNAGLSPAAGDDGPSTWGEGSVAELRRLLPADAVFLCQCAVAGSAIGAFAGELTLGIGSDAGATAFVVALGPRAGTLAPVAALDRVDLGAQRSWESRLQARATLAPALMAANAKLGEAIGHHDRWVAEWRTYIHELETKLGVPLSGVSAESHPPQPGELEAAANA